LVTKAPGAVRDATAGGGEDEADATVSESKERRPGIGTAT
jgi:hypothetical protein